MTINKHLQKAKDSLLISDVYIESLTCQTADDFVPKFDESSLNLEVESKHLVRRTKVIELDNDGQLLIVEIEVGARWVIPAPEGNDEPSIKATIEACFIAEYIIQEPLEDESIKQFSLENVSYHIWPYWRELLSSQCERMRLSRITLPTIQLAANRHAEEGNVEPES